VSHGEPMKSDYGPYFLKDLYTKSKMGFPV